MARLRPLRRSALAPTGVRAVELLGERADGAARGDGRRGACGGQRRLRRARGSGRVGGRARSPGRSRRAGRRHRAAGERRRAQGHTGARRPRARGVALHRGAQRGRHPRPVRAPARAMRVLLTSPSMQVGGAERVMTLLAAELVKRGHEVAVVAPPRPLAPEHRAQLDAEFRLGGDAPLAITIGRLVPQKAHQRFLRAAAVAAETLPDARFLIVGEGPLRAEIEAQVAAAGLGDRVRLTGVRSDARDLIARSDALVFSSDWEGLSIAALEALAAGVPVVSTDVEGMRDLLAGGAGVTAPLDDGTALGRRIAEVLSDPERRREMGRAGEALIATEFSPAGMIDAYEALYYELTGR